MDYHDFQVGMNSTHFWVKGRMRLIEILLNRLPGDRKNRKILDVGTGVGEYLSLIKQFGNVYAVDVDQHALDLIPQDLVIEKRLADACNLPYEEKNFDVVVAFDVLEHVKNDQNMVDEMLRVLKPGGYFVFTVPAFNALFSEHDRVLKHFRRYNKGQVDKLFGSFTKVDLGYWFFLLFFPAALKRILTKRSRTKNSLERIPKILNKTFTHLLSLENWLIEVGCKLPFGLTIYGIYRKN